MSRALQLAKNGAGRTLSNPMVGAVIVARGKIIGEGWHRRYGGPHAEVNAVRSVSDADRELLRESCIYVTLEPCSHYGKTPPCAKLLIESDIPEIVVGATDPFPEVAGRGLRMLREAGRTVRTGVLETECVALNRRFMTAHSRGYPYIQLKWAQTADGILGIEGDVPPLVISNDLSRIRMHRERAKAGAIMVGVNTVVNDNPSLDCRLWPGDDPLRLSFDSPRLPAQSRFMAGTHLLRKKNETLPDFMERLYHDHKILSVMVEGGGQTLDEFIHSGLFDELRVEINPAITRDSITECADHHYIHAPKIPSEMIFLDHTEEAGKNLILTFLRSRNYK